MDEFHGKKDDAEKTADLKIRIAGRALRTGKETRAQIRSTTGRIESERAAVKRAKKSCEGS